MSDSRAAPVRRWLVLAAAALALSTFVQRHVEQRRVEASLTWSDPADKQALETGFLALGGFRGLIADMLWMRAVRLQDSARYYELKLLCDLIQKLQPTFTHVHAFQAHNMAFNLARRGATCDDKWYWIRSGLMSLEKGLQRTKRHYSLWFEIGLIYADRLNDIKFGECRELRRRVLPNIDELTEEQRAAPFLSSESWRENRSRPDEYLRWGAYNFFKSVQTGNDPMPLRSERMYGHCIERLGFWISAPKPPAQRQWNEWGAEDWWVALREKNRERGYVWDISIPQNLQWCMFQQMDFYSRRAETKAAADAEGAEADRQRAAAAFARFQKYFPEDKRGFGELLEVYRRSLARTRTDK